MKRGKIHKKVKIQLSSGVTYEVPLRIELGSRGALFIIDIDTPGRVEVESRSVEEVIALAKVELEKLVSIDWKPWIKIEVKGNEGRFDADDKPTDLRDEARLEISYTLIDVAKRGNKTIWREMEEEPDKDGICTRAPTSSSWVHENDPFDVDEDEEEGDYEDRSSRWGSCGRVEDNACVSLIEDTPDNRMRVDAVIAGLHRLKREVKTLLNRKNILSTLTATPTVLALPAPKLVEILPGIEIQKPGKIIKRRKRSKL